MSLLLYHWKRFLTLFLIVIKPGPARRVNPGPGRPGGWAGPGLIKDWLWQQPGQTRATRTRPDFFFSNVGFEIH